MGFVHIYCGDGKGKTSAAAGFAVRAAGRGRNVVVARFLKNDDSGEVEGLRALSSVRVIPCTENFGFVFQMDEETKKKAAAYNRSLFDKAVEYAAGADLLVLDEILAAVNYSMVPESAVTEFIKTRPEKLEVVLTGRNPSGALMELADYISEIRKIKHPFDRGILAREGIEY